jgi:hypothetical protein
MAMLLKAVIDCLTRHDTSDTAPISALPVAAQRSEVYSSALPTD